MFGASWFILLVSPVGSVFKGGDYGCSLLQSHLYTRPVIVSGVVSQRALALCQEPLADLFSILYFISLVVIWFVSVRVFSLSAVSADFPFHTSVFGCVFRFVSFVCINGISFLCFGLQKELNTQRSLPKPGGVILLITHPVAFCLFPSPLRL